MSVSGTTAPNCGTANLINGGGQVGTGWQLAADWQSASSSSRRTAGRYDSLGRQIKVTTPDSAATTTTYSANTITVTDPAGNKRELVRDALGRTTDVYEDPTGANFHTKYAYLNNTVTVTQGAQTRQFVSDTLGRQLSATNPESYTYDNAGIY